MGHKQILIVDSEFSCHEDLRNVFFFLDQIKGEGPCKIDSIYDYGEAVEIYRRFARVHDYPVIMMRLPHTSELELRRGIKVAHELLALAEKSYFIIYSRSREITFPLLTQYFGLRSNLFFLTTPFETVTIQQMVYGLLENWRAQQSDKADQWAARG